MSTAAGRSSDEGGGVMNGAGDWAAAPLLVPRAAGARRRRARTGNGDGVASGHGAAVPARGMAKGRRVGRVLRPDGHGLALLAIAAAPTGILYKRNLHNIIKAEL